MRVFGSVGAVMARSIGAGTFLVVAALIAVAAGVLASPALALNEPFGPEAFGVYLFENTFENQDKTPTVQAGSHPYTMTSTVIFNHTVTEINEQCEENIEEECLNTEEPEVRANIYGSPKHIEVRLPPGLVVNPNVTKVKCTEAELEKRPVKGGGCPEGSAVGVDFPSVSPFGEGLRSAIYAMVPPPGSPAEFGVDPGGVGFIFHVAGNVLTGEGYRLVGEVADTTQAVNVYGAKLVFWGDPTDESHDVERGFCATKGRVLKEIEKEFFEHGHKQFNRFNCPLPDNERTHESLLTMPGSCPGSQLESRLSADSWQEPDNVIAPPMVNTTAEAAAMTGCDKLHFKPSLDVRPAPGEASAESPSALNVDLKLPLQENEGLAEANLKKAVVKLPAGLAVSPSSANGLGACTPAQIGLHDENKPSCPDSSKIGEAEVTTPLLEHSLTGAVYLAQQETFENSLIALYIVVEGQGALIKLGGTVALDSNTGQITATFDNNPQLPFSDLKLKFFSGPRAPLITPTACGTYAGSAQLSPWSGGAPAEVSTGDFSVSANCDHLLTPSFTAGTTNIQAGAYTPFSLTLSRQNGEQRFGSIRVTMPPGLLANLKSVPLCPEPQASKGECGEASLIGESTAAAGPGEDPYWVKGGRVYLTVGYGGAPFGLSIVVPAIAGPFNLGNVIARASIGVDSHTAQAIVTSDIPTIKDGIPLDVRTINVTINRAGFTFNPTNCNPTSVTAILTSTTNNLAGLATPFDVANCAALTFKPSFAASTPAKTSKAKGAGLTVRVGSGAGQANIGKVRVILPKQLPARLTTLQKACTEATFNINPALCPPASDVGSATAVTPVLAHPLTGPAYLVSHGGAAFPDLVFVLQGEGILLYLDGNTNIKKGITSSTFNSVPDAPISTFEATFPQGATSVLATDIPVSAKGSMCQQKLTMPTTITGQNGAVMTQTTKIVVKGCPKKTTKKKAKAKSPSSRRK